MMKLEDFVSETILQITRGVQKAQPGVKESGGLLNPYMRTVGRELSIGQAEGRGGEVVSLIEYDVALTVDEKSGTQGGIGVVAGMFTLGSKGKSSKGEATVSRVKFSIPILLPTQKPPGKE